MNHLETLNAITPGWTESRPGRMLCNPSKFGGIIDQAPAINEWFVVFADGRETLHGYASRADAIEAYCAQYLKP